MSIAVPVACVGTVAAVAYIVHADRAVDVELAMARTTGALALLREAKAVQLSGKSASYSYVVSDLDGDEEEIESRSDIQRALDTYEAALKEELELRQFHISGVMVRVSGLPGDHPCDREEDQAAVKQFFDMEITEVGSF